MPTCNLDIPRPLRARVDAFSLEQQAWLVNEDDAVGQRRETMLALWGPSSDAGRRVHEFEEFLSQGVKHWKSISEYHDGLQSHRLSCKLNHSSQFQSFEDAVAKFLKAATIVVDILIPATEREFGTLRNGAALKQCRDEARSISSPVDFELLD